MTETLEAEHLNNEVTRLQGAYADALEALEAKPHVNIRRGEGWATFGPDDNFISYYMYPDKTHIIAGRKPHHGEEEEADPNAFHAWDVVLKEGEPKSISFASHAWKSGEKADSKVSTSPSNGIQDDNPEAIAGADELLAHFKKAH